MRLFGRKKGRHALGAAVTSIPSGPVQGAVSPPVAAPAATAAVPPPVVVPAGEPDLMTSIAELIASGEAWATEASVEKLPRVCPAPAATDVPLAPATAPPSVTLGASLPATPVTPFRVPVPTPVALPPSVTSARPSLEPALIDLLPPEAPQQPTSTPAAGRVELGFRDGTSTTLEPGSIQALALEELAQSLTRRD